MAGLGTNGTASHSCWPGKSRTTDRRTSNSSPAAQDPRESDVYVVDNKFAPGGTSGWHSHPGPSLILVVAGTVTNYSGDDPSCTPHVYTKGDGFIDPGSGDVHMLRNETSAPAETIAVQLLPKAAVESCCSTDRRRGSQRLPLLGSGRMPEGGPVPTLRRSPPRKEKARLDVTLAGTSGSARRLVLEPRLRSCALRCRMRRGLAMAA